MSLVGLDLTVSTTGTPSIGVTTVFARYTPAHLRGYSATFAVFDSAQSTLLTLSSKNGGLSINRAAGAITNNMSNANAVSLGVGKFTYSLTIASNGGTVELLSGAFTVTTGAQPVNPAVNVYYLGAQGPAGASARVNITDAAYGGVLNDSTSGVQAANATALANAIADAQANGGIVYIPAGAFYFSSGVTISAGITIEGDGRSRTQLYYTGASTGITIQNCTDALLRDLTIDAVNGQPVLITATSAATYGPIFRNVKFARCATTQVSVYTNTYDIYHTVFDTCWFAGGNNNSATCISVTHGAGNGRWVYSNLSNCVFSGVSDVFNWQHAQHIKAYGCLFYSVTGTVWKFVGCSFCNFLGVGLEGPAVSLYSNLDSGTADNFFQGDFQSLSPTNWVDAGTRNDVYGSDGSSGSASVLKQTLQLPMLQTQKITYTTDATLTALAHWAYCTVAGKTLTLPAANSAPASTTIVVTNATNGATTVAGTIAGGNVTLSTSYKTAAFMTDSGRWIPVYISP